MTDETPAHAESDDAPATEHESVEDSPPTDESYLVGATGVEQDVLAELARAEAEMADPEHNPAHDDDGAVV